MSATAHVAGAIATRIASTSYGSQLSQGPLAQVRVRVCVCVCVLAAALKCPAQRAGGGVL